MKIYYIANAHMPTVKAHGIQLAKMCEAFVDCGANLELILPNTKRELYGMGEFYGLKQNIKQKYLPVFRGGAGRVGFLLSAVSFSVSCFIYMLLEKFRGNVNLIYTIDLDHFSFLSVPFLRIPYFVEVHGLKKTTFFHSFFFNQAKGMVATNSFIKDYLVRSYGVDKDKILVQPNGIDFEKFSSSFSKEDARKKLGISLDKSIAIYSGRFYGWKGLGILMEAAKILENVSFYLVGGLKEDLTKILSYENFPSNVVFAGHKDYKEMPQWLAAADVLLVLGTSKNSDSYFYTSPMKIFEYMASRRPIVASRTPANAEIATSNEAFFYTPDDTGDFVSQIRSALRNQAAAEKKAFVACQKAKSLDWRERAKNILSFMEYNVK